MTQAIKAYISDKHMDGSAAYIARHEATEHAGLGQPAEVVFAEAQRILANVEPDDGTGDAMHQFLECMAPWEQAIMAESLAEVAADGGLLDQLAWSIPTIGQTSAIAHRNSL